ncbi:Alpha/Beta hydrolase protein [Mycena sp. CBHHK59/15]|nr:Alpha/Beta hydrolase protein [Mycena sp. CBHHK59/15]
MLVIVRTALTLGQHSDSDISTISASQIATYRPYTYFAGTGYCPANYTRAWSCAANCLANPDFNPVASGGNGFKLSVLYWFVGYSPSLKRVIVSLEGTRVTSILSMLTNTSISRITLNPALFPGISSDIGVHSGFADEHTKTATDILIAVKSALSTFGASRVTLVGHSLIRHLFNSISAALSLLDSVYLPLHLPSPVVFNTIAYGFPRVGNQAFADYVDANLSLTHINNQKDTVPVVPGKAIEYRHSAGEVHIQASEAWYSCPGQDNDSDLCIVGDVPNLFSDSIPNLWAHMMG